MKTLNNILRPKDVNQIIEDVNASNYIAFLRGLSKKIETNEYKDIIPIFEKIDPGVYSNKIFNDACKYNCQDLVNIMLKKRNFDPSYKRNFALRIAHHHNSYEVVEILMKDRRVTSLLNQDEIINIQIYLDSVLE